MFVTEMFTLIYGMLNSAEEVQERKWEREKVKIIPTLNIQRTYQSESKF